jgi:HSP20 family protein
MLPVRSNLIPTVSRFFDDDWDNLFDWNAKRFGTKDLSMPAVNIHENDDEYCFEMAAPGLDKNQFKIELNKNRLTIAYHMENSHEESDEASKYVRKEYNFNSFSRSFHLNKNVVDDDNIKASYENGILRINVAKREEAKEKPARLIDIS